MSTSRRLTRLARPRAALALGYAAQALRARSPGGEPPRALRLAGNAARRLLLGHAAPVPDALFLKEGYRSREAAEYFVDDASGSDGRVHQPDVYPFAAHLARRYGAQWLVDIGCGRAEKAWAHSDEFKIAGIDIGPNLEFCRHQHPDGLWRDVDLERPGQLPLTDELLRSSVVVCSDVIEHLVDPRPLLAELARVRQHALALVISTPERDLVRGLEDPGPPANPFHVREWNLDELVRLLTAAGLEPAFAGLTVNNDVDLLKRTSVVVVEGTRMPALATPPEEFRVLAVVTAYNERDILLHTARRLLNDGLEVVVIDDSSSDGTGDALRAEFGHAVDVVRPSKPNKGTYDWGLLLEQVESIGRASGADWVVHHDADEVREGPWPGLTLRDSLWNMQRRGFNAVDHTVIDFRPVQGEAELADGDDPEQALRWWEFGRRGGHFCRSRRGATPAKRSASPTRVATRPRSLDDAWLLTSSCSVTTRCAHRSRRDERCSRSGAHVGTKMSAAVAGTATTTASAPLTPSCGQPSSYTCGTATSSAAISWSSG